MSISNPNQASLTASFLITPIPLRRLCLTQIFQDFHDIFASSYTKMLGLDPSIIKHHTKTCILTHLEFNRSSNLFTPPRLHLSRWRLTNSPRKDSFIQQSTLYGFRNLVLITKKQGTIHVCTNFHDLNHACINENFPRLFIKKTLTNRQAMKSSPSWMHYLVKIKSRYSLRISTKLLSLLPRELLHIT